MPAKSTQKRPQSHPNEDPTDVLNIWYFPYGIHFRCHWHEPETFFCQMPTSRTHFLCFCQFWMQLTPKQRPKWTTPFSRKLHKTRLFHQKGPPGLQKSPKCTHKPAKVGTKALQMEVLSLKSDWWKRTTVCLFSYRRNDDMQDPESKKCSEECKTIWEETS